MIRKHYNDVFFDGKSLADFGVHVSGEAVFKSPEKIYESVEVAGQNGSLLIDSGRFANVTMKYPAFILADTEREFKELVSNFINYMMSRSGYKRLEDTYYPDEYKLAYYKGPFDPEVIMLQGGNFDLEFERKPQRYLKTGEEPRTYTGNPKVYNPTQFNAYPLIRMYGYQSGEAIRIGANRIGVSSHGYEYIDFDCDTLNATYGDVNCNSLITLSLASGYEKIPLLPGDNNITKAAMSKFDIYPRWWII